MNWLMAIIIMLLIGNAVIQYRWNRKIHWEAAKANHFARESHYNDSLFYEHFLHIESRLAALELKKADESSCKESDK